MRYSSSALRSGQLLSPPNSSMSRQHAVQILHCIIQTDHMHCVEQQRSLFKVGVRAVDYVRHHHAVKLAHRDDYPTDCGLVTLGNGAALAWRDSK